MTTASSPRLTAGALRTAERPNGILARVKMMLRDVPAMIAVTVRPAGSSSGVGIRSRPKAGEAKRSVMSSLSGKRCRRWRLSPTTMLIWSCRSRWLTGWISAACSHADAINASWCC